MLDLKNKGTPVLPRTEPPDISAKVIGSIVKVRVIKAGNKGYVLQSRVQGDAGWTDLGPTTAPRLKTNAP